MSQMTKVFASLDLSNGTGATVLKNEDTNKFHVVFVDTEADETIGIIVYPRAEQAVAKALALCPTTSLEFIR